MLNIIPPPPRRSSQIEGTLVFFGGGGVSKISQTHLQLVGPDPPARFPTRYPIQSEIVWECREVPAKTTRSLTEYTRRTHARDQKYHRLFLCRFVIYCLQLVSMYLLPKLLFFLIFLPTAAFLTTRSPRPWLYFALGILRFHPQDRCPFNLRHSSIVPRAKCP